MINTIEPKKEARIPAILNQTDKTLSVLHGQLNELENGLGTVLTQIPADNGTPSPERPKSNQICDRIEDINNSINRAINRISEIIKRLEV